jgi:hypothetical protein
MKFTCLATQLLTACLLSVGVSVAVAQQPVSNNVPPPPPVLLARRGIRDSGRNPVGLPIWN